jgi:hypothetical protein
MGVTIKETKDLIYAKVVDIFYKVDLLNYPKKRQEYKSAIEKALKNIF